MSSGGIDMLDRSGPDATGDRHPSNVLVRGIHVYQLARANRPTGCRYVPTCSEYAAEAIGRYGTLRGMWLAARRLGRCHPWGGQGFDPVPEGSEPCSDH